MNAKQIRRFDQEVRLAWEFRMQLPYEARTAYDRVPEEEWPSGGPLAVVAYRLLQVDEEFEMNPPLDRDAHTTVLHVLHRVQTARGLHEMLANARKQGEAAGTTNERAAIVAWLQAVEDDGRGSTWQWADAIARGEHVE